MSCASILVKSLFIGPRKNEDLTTRQTQKNKPIICTPHTLYIRNAHHRLSQRTPPPHIAILPHPFFPSRSRINLQTSALYPRPSQTSPSLPILRKSIRPLARCNPPRHLQQQPARSRTAPCPAAINGSAQTSPRSGTRSGEMGDRVSKPEMDGRGERESPPAVHRREIQPETSLLPRLAVRRGVPYTAACADGQAFAAGCEDEGAAAEAVVRGAIGRDVGSARHLSRHLTLAHLS